MRKYKKDFITSWTIKRSEHEVAQLGLDPMYILLLFFFSFIIFSLFPAGVFLIPSPPSNSYQGPAALEALKKLMIGPVSRDVRDQQDDDVLSLVLTIFRNILHVSDQSKEKKGERERWSVGEMLCSFSKRSVLSFVFLLTSCAGAGL